MLSLRTTNFLLAVIALCLVALVGKNALMAVVPEAQAQAAQPGQEVKLMGCFAQYGSQYPGSCKWQPVRITERGEVVTAKQ